MTKEEFTLVKAHPVYSAQLLKAQFAEEIKLGALFHHERENGTGYPKGLKGEEIPIFAKITAISDVYDAMISDRSYKEAVIPFEILDRVRKAEFEGLDSVLVALFVKNMIKYYRYKQVRMSDGTHGNVAYIPPNDISHPIVQVDEIVKQVDEVWYCVQVV